jgi:hypothetical protein
MNLLQPQNLLWLLLLPVLLWLALPPRPRQTLWTPHLAQWHQAHAALKRRPPRLSGPRFLLLAIACAAAVLAHAAPVWSGREGPDRLVVLLDGSASMGANAGDGATAFGAAQARLRERFAELPEHVAVTVLRCGGPRLRRHGASARCLQDLGEPEGPLDVDLAAIARAAAADDTVVWTLTDGQGPGPLPAVGALSLFPASGPNAAVLAVRATDRWPLPQMRLEVDVGCFAPGAATVSVRVAGAVAQVPATPLRVSPGATATVAFELQRDARGGALEVSIEMPGDALRGDDRWLAALPPLPAPSIAVLASDEVFPFARVAAEALAAEVGGEVVAAGPGVQAGLLLADGGAVPVAPGRVRAVCFGSRYETAAEPEPWLEPQVLDWDRIGPLAAGLDLAELSVQAAFRGTLPPGQPFLWADDGKGGREPLAVIVDGGETASIHFAFRLQDSNLPLLPAFPQLLRRAFVRSYGEAARLQVSSPAPAPGEQDLRPASGRPEGRDRPLPPFSTPDRDLGAMCLLLGLLALALRAFVR